MRKMKLSEILMLIAMIILLITLVLSIFPYLKYWKESGLWIFINHFNEVKHIVFMYFIGIVFYISANVVEKHKK